MHLYLGSTSENNYDTPEEVRKERAGKGGKVGGKVAAETHRQNGTGFFDPEFQKKVHEGNQKPVVLTRVSDGEELPFPSLTAAVEALQGSNGCLKRVLNGKQETHRGYKARFAD